SNEGNAVSPHKLAGIYKIYDSLHLFEITKSTRFGNQTLAELDLTTKYGVTVVSIERNGNSTFTRLQNRMPLIPKAGTRFQDGDLVLLCGEPDNIQSIIKEFNLSPLKRNSDSRKQFLP